jgi:hypothetical protein
VIGVSRGTDGEGQETVEVGDIEGVLWCMHRGPIPSLVVGCGGIGVVDRGVGGGDRLTILIVVTACLYN